ncbi:solute carrier family 49 member 4 isoform X2 [Octopus bimaculoides]|nr:solute carrier family 49 member 4 isoform X2 [Octopus bimaculoides]|eukprot:XP_014781014.1 PREDICTED: disrupted in renal carcinoma protein 2 homolog isoform X2 [Octopus bimaculoides]
MDKESRSLVQEENSVCNYESNHADTPRTSSIDENQQSFKVYKRRWYILFLFAFFAFTQSLHWNTWPPIAQTTNELFGWTVSNVALLTNWGPITYTLCALPISWVIETKGLRTTCLITSLSLFLGSGIRSITLKTPYIYWLSNVGQIIIGFAAPFTISASTALSSAWFPMHQRFTATAIANVFLTLGASASLFVGPLVVSTNASISNSTSNHSSFPVINSSVYEDHLEKERIELRTLLFSEFGMSAVIFFLVVIYFPNKPPSPPTMSARMERLNFTEGITNLMKNYRFWMLAAIYTLCSGVISSWLAVIYINLKPHNISQKSVGIFSIYIGIGSCLGSLVLAKLSDMFVNYTRIFLSALITISIGLLTWFQLMYENVLHITDVQLTLSITLSMIFLTSIYPILYEMSSEAAFPIAEGVANGVLNLLSNAVSLVFLFILMIPNIGVSWMNWTLLTAVICVLPVICAFRNKFRRIEIDKKYLSPS